jgi:RecA-family ATPase
LLTARKVLGYVPDVELFDKARASLKLAIQATDSNAVRAAGVTPQAELQRGEELKAQKLDAALKAQANAPEEQQQTTEELRKEIAADVDAGNFSNPNLLDDVVTDLPPIIEETESKAKAVNPRRLGMTYKQMRSRNKPPPEYLIEGLIPKEGVGALAGEPKAAKSWDATYYAVCVAAGVPVFGRFSVYKPRRVFYYYAEDTESAVNNRVSAIAAELGLDPAGEWTERLVMQPRGRPLDVMNTAALCVLAASVKDFEKPDDRFALLILDPLSNIHSGEEDKRDSMVKVMARLHALEQYLKLAVLFVHHSGKDSADTKGRKRGGQKMRGSSAIHAAVDFGIYLSNLRGDGESEFVARTESEMKAARSAGIFDRKLEITDNDKGNAERAKFTWEKPKETKPGEGNSLADQRAHLIVKFLWNQQSSMTFDELKRKIKGGSNIVMRAIDVAEEAGWIQPKMHGARHQGYEITDAGRELIRNGGTGTPNETGDPSPSSPPQIPPSKIETLENPAVTDTKN